MFIKIGNTIKGYFDKYHLFTIIFFSFILRLVNINYILDNFLFSADENQIVNPAINIAISGNLNPGIYKYPTFVIHLLSFFYYIYIKIMTFFFNLPKEYFYTDAYIVVLGRSIGLLFGIGSIYFIYKISETIGDRNTAIMSAILISINHFHIALSVTLKIDIFHLFFITSTFYFLIKIIKNGKLKYYLFCGISTGFCIATYYDFLILIINAVIILRQIKLSNGINILNIKQLFLILVLPLLLFMSICPYSILNVIKTFDSVTSILYGHNISKAPLFNISNCSIFKTRYIYQFFILLPFITNSLIYITSLMFIFSLDKSVTKGVWPILLLYPIFWIFLISTISNITIPDYLLPALPYFIIMSSLFTMRRNKHLRYFLITILIMHSLLNINAAFSILSHSDRAYNFVKKIAPIGSKILALEVFPLRCEKGCPIEIKNFDKYEDIEKKIVNGVPDFIVINHWVLTNYLPYNDEGEFYRLLFYKLLSGEFQYKVIEKFKVKYFDEIFYSLVDPALSNFEVSILRRANKKVNF